MGYTTGREYTTLSSSFRGGRTESPAAESSLVQRHLSPTAARLAGIAAWLVAFGSFLTARSNQLSRDEAGTISLLFGLTMIAMHVAFRRRAYAVDGSSDASLAALIGALTVPAGLAALLWDPGIANSSFIFLFSFSRDGTGNGLLLSAVVFLAAYGLGRDARWLLAAPLVTVAGVELRLAGNGSVSLAAGGSWTRFLVLLAAIAALVAAASWVARAERHNLLLAAALITPFAFSSYPAQGESVLRDIVGAVLLAGLVLITWRRLSLGMGLAIVLLGLFEVASLSAGGRGLLPPALFALVGAALILAGAVSARAAPPSPPTPS